MKTILKTKLFFLFFLSFISTQAQCVDSFILVSDGLYMLKQDGTLLGIGRNTSGELGNGTNVSTTTLSQIGTDSDWTNSGKPGWGFLFIKTNGTMWGTGRNIEGQLGLGNNTNQFTLTQVGSDNNWSKICGAGLFNAAIKTDGTLWTSGNNMFGQLGDGTYNNRNVFAQVGTDTNWSKIYATNASLCAIKTDGTLWFCGYNGNGNSGDGTIILNNTGITTLQQVGTDTDWKIVKFGTNQVIGLKQNGTIWTWGDNFQGQLGDGTLNSHYFPTQLGTDTDWKDIMTSASILALKTNGTLWSWGSNSKGNLGDGTMINRLSPNQIGTDTNWINIYEKGFNSMAKKQDGTLYRWGSNAYNIFDININPQDNQLTPIIYTPNCTLSTNDLEENKILKGFPNPTTNLFTLQYSMNQDEIVEITVINAFGQKMYSKKERKTILDYQQQIDFSGFSSGLYFVSFQTSNHLATLKIIKN